MSGAGTPTFRSAYEQLARAQKSAAGVPLYTRFINRKAGRAVAAWASLRAITPNQLTLISTLLSLSGIATIALWPPSAPVLAIAFALLATGYVLDSADGQLARLTQTGSPLGEWLDHVVDAIRAQAFHAGIAISLWRFADVSLPLLAVTWLFAAIVGVRFFAQILAEQLRRTVSAPAQPAAPSFRGTVLQLPADTGVINLVVLLLGSSTLFLAVYLALAVANGVLAAVSLLRRFHELGALQAIEPRPLAAGAKGG